jgi:hypothetical protein
MSQIPAATHPVWESLVTGRTKHKFSLFAANMAVDRVSRAYAANQSMKHQLIGELRDFFKKYESVTAAEVASLS